VIVVIVVDMAIVVAVSEEAVVAEVAVAVANAINAGWFSILF
jgi:hypothetical protein